MGRRNRPSHPAPRRNRSRRAAGEVAARARFDHEPERTTIARRTKLHGKPPPAPIIRCVTGKVGFLTEHAAEVRLEEIRSDLDRRRRESTPSRIYRCPKCDGWHFTSEAKG